MWQLVVAAVSRYSPDTRSSLSSAFSVTRRVRSRSEDEIEAEGPAERGGADKAGREAYVS